MMIIYAATAGLSVGAMFLTGIIPGLMIGIGQIVFSFYYAFKHEIGADHEFSWRNLLKHAKSASLALVIPIIVIGGIIAGIFTATEASLIAVVYAFFLSIVYRQFSFKKFYKLTTFSIGFFSLSLFCVAAASLWGFVLAYYSVPQSIVASLDSMGLLGSKLLVFTFVILIFLIIGTFMDAIPAIIILQPIIGEIGTKVGINPYHMGAVIVLTLAIGLITPPYGLCLLIAADLAGISVPKALKAMIPFFVISLIVVLFAVLFPDAILFIPRLVMPEYMK